MHQRKLNEIEYMNWTMGQPFNISMAISIKGAIDPKDMENALRKVQQKHPMLRAQLYTDHKKKPHFIWGKVGSIPLKILKRNSEDHYKNVVEKEFITPFETGKECKLPLARAIFLRDETHSDLALTLQHVIADGLSMVYLFLDLFRFLRRPKRAPKENKIMKKFYSYYFKEYYNASKIRGELVESDSIKETFQILENYMEKYKEAYTKS